MLNQYFSVGETIRGMHIPEGFMTSFMVEREGDTFIIKLNHYVSQPTIDFYNRIPLFRLPTNGSLFEQIVIHKEQVEAWRDKSREQLLLEYLEKKEAEVVEG